MNASYGELSPALVFRQAFVLAVALLRPVWHDRATMLAGVLQSALDKRMSLTLAFIQSRIYGVTSQTTPSL
jgi:hypothetical protein